MAKYESHTIRRVLARTALGLALLSAGAAVPALAQGDANGNNAGTTTRDNDDRGFNPGWLGLIGLAGLAGLRRRDHVDTTSRR